MKRVIKRYENRKLYDTETRKYISLEEIADLIRQGSEISVIEKNGGADITAQTLTQVILDEGKRGNTLFNADTLHHVIRWGTSVLDEGFRQVREGVDQLLPASFGKLFQFAANKDADTNSDGSDMNDLKKRIEDLETLIHQVTVKADENKQKSSKKSP